MSSVALIVGVSGLVGSSLAEYLVRKDWTVIGLARRPWKGVSGLTPITVDLLKPTELSAALEAIKPTHVFYATWSRRSTEAQNIWVNGSMLRNLLGALRSKDSVEHIAIVTGLKHYIGPFEIYARSTPPATPFREELPRLDIPNFYYTLEDELFSAARRDGFTWSVHRPHTLVGYAERSVMNMGGTIGVYAAYCKATGRPFIFPGNEVQWNGLTDVTDARLLAQHLVWAATTPAAWNEALHVVNGDVFRWKWMWVRIADWFGIEAVPPTAAVRPLVNQMADARPVWRDIAHHYRLVESELDRIASFWHTDGDLLRPFECVTDMSKSRELGFIEYQTTDRVFLDLFSRLRQERIIPAV